MTPELALELVRPIAGGMPFNRVLGVTLEVMNATGATMELPHRAELANNPATGILHGGVVSAVLDVVGGLSALSAIVFDRDLDTIESILGLFSTFGTVDLRVDYLRPGMGERFISSGTVMRSGRRIAVVRTEFHNQDETLLATGTATYITG